MAKKSKKPLIPLSQVIKPFVIEAHETIEGGINGQRFELIKGKTYALTYPEFEALMNAKYIVL